MPSRDHDPDDRVYDATSPMVRIVEGLVDLVVLIVYSIFQAFVAGIKAAFGWGPSEQEAPPLAHPEPDPTGAYRTGTHDDRGNAGPEGGDADNT